MRERGSRILLVEDSDDDAALVIRVHRRLGRSERVDVVSDPELVMESLREEGMPRLLLLDLKLPRKSGLELLREIRSHEQFQRLPIIVLTASGEAQDLSLAYELGANSCIHKHVEYEMAMETLRSTFDYWLCHNLMIEGSTSNARVRETA